MVSETESMLPALGHRDLIVIRRFDFYRLQEGDFVTFESMANMNGQRKSIFVTHQIIGVVVGSDSGQQAYRTSGVHPNVPPDIRLMTIDGANYTNRYVGKYAFHFAWPGRARGFLTSTPGLIALSVNSVCLIAIWFIISKKTPKESFGAKKHEKRLSI